MQAFISKYGLAAHLALLAVSPLFLFPFFDEATTGEVLLWLSAFGAGWLFMEPSRRNGERLGEARARVRTAIFRDPLFWGLVAICVFAAVRAANGGIGRIYDASSQKWILSSQFCALFPGHSANHGFLEFASAVAATVAVPGCRNALGKSGRIAFAGGLGVFAALAALATSFGAAFGAEGALAAAGCADGVVQTGADAAIRVSSAGLAYGIALLASIAAAAGIFESRWNKTLLLFSFAIGGSAAGLYYFSPASVLLLFAALAVLTLIGCAVYVGVVRGATDLLRFFAVVFISAVVPVLIGLTLFPNWVSSGHGEFLYAWDVWPNNVFGEGFFERRAALSEYALTFWRDSAWIGCGIGAFRDSLWTAGAEVKGLMSSGPLNGWLLLVAERGIVGAATFAAPLAFMIFTFGRRIVAVVRGRQITFIPLPVLGVMVLLASAALSFFDCSLLRADGMISAGAVFAVAVSALPAPVKRADGDEDGQRQDDGRS